MSELALEETMVDQLENALVVADTSVLLASDPKMLYSFPPSIFVVPHIVVNELEDKRSHPTLGYLARQWLRFLEKLRVEHGKSLQLGVKPEGMQTTVLLEPNHRSQRSLPEYLQNGSNDSTILAICQNFKEDLADLKSSSGVTKILLLSNDTPMRLHATLDLEIEATEYNATVATGSKPYSGLVDVDVSPEEYADFVSAGADFVAARNMLDGKLEGDDVSAARCSIRVTVDGKASGGTFLKAGDAFSLLSPKQSVGSIFSRNLEQNVALSYLRESPESLPIVSVSGGAGTGKTLLTIAVALEEVKRKHYSRVIVFRSLHEMGVGQEMGFLPGDVDDKMLPWSGAIMDALDVIVAGTRSAISPADQKKILAECIEVSPITYLRGRSISNAFIVLDEAQNFSRNELLNIISRVGENTKIVLLSDSNQVDNKFLQSGSKSDVWSVVDGLKNEQMFAHVTLQKTERSRVAELASELLRR